MTSHQPALTDYFSCQDKAKRLELLRQLPATLDASLIRDLLSMNLATEEQILLVQRAANANNDEFEQLLIEIMTTTHQDIAVIALQRWVTDSHKTQAQAIIPLLSSPQRPQRLLYRLLEASAYLGGTKAMDAVLANPMLESLAPAFHALLLNRAVWHNFASPVLGKLADLSTDEIDSTQERLYEKSLPGALAYVARFNPPALQDIAKNIAAGSVWRSLIHAVVNDTLDKPATIAKVDRIIAQAKQNANLNLYTLSCLPMWSRHFLTANQIALIAEAFSQNGDHHRLWQCLAGAEVKTLVEALACTTDLNATVALLAITEVLTSNAEQSLLKAHLTKAVQKHGRDVVKRLTPRLLALSGEPGVSNATKSTAASQSGASRHYFFDLAYRKSKTATAPAHDDDPLFAAMAKAWHSRKDGDLDHLSELARKSAGIWTTCYIHCLGRFKQSDKAVLKLLDFIRSTDETLVRTVIQALHRINSPRASLELISALTRPNTSMQIKLEISNLLKELDLSSLQRELRSALNDMPAQVDTGTIHYEIRDNIAAQLTPQAATALRDAEQPTQPGDHSELDAWLANKVKAYPDLSSEVKRALRTARFFHVTATQSSLTSIDLSPAVDMQYKALELSFREMFEHACGELIESGHIQRKLDVIGYARPIESAMSQFENYISNLPVIVNIPFFSKFKLRKMLRAICQYRPGKRFTLDGIKAFALFFLVFGRQECRYGLAGMMSLPFKNDTELAEFCRLLHIFQDTRNRAAHEGFQPDASKDIDAIWTWTSEIYKQAVLMSAHIARPSTSVTAVDAGKHSRQSPQIVYKKTAS